MTHIIDGPSMPYLGPYAHVGASGTTYGPMPPPSKNTDKGGDSEEAIMGEEDQEEIQKSLNERDDPQSAAPETTMIDTKEKSSSPTSPPLTSIANGPPAEVKDIGGEFE